MASKYYVEIDGASLKEEFKNRGLKLRAVSEELGFSASLLTDAIRYGKIRTSVATLLDKLYNISPDVYVKQPEPEPAPEDEAPKEETVPTIGIDALYEVIYKAVYNAVKNAWMDE